MGQKLLIWFTIVLTGALVSYGLSFLIFWKSHTVSNYSGIVTSQMLISSNGMDRFMERVYSPLLNHSFFDDRVWYDADQAGVPFTSPQKKLIPGPKPKPVPPPKDTPVARATSDLMKAVPAGDAEGVRNAIARGGIVWTMYPGRNTLLHRNAQQGNATITEILLQHGLSLTATNSEGLNPLALAIRHNHATLAGMLRAATATNCP